MPNEPTLPDERVVARCWERQSYDPGILAALGLRLIYRGVPSDAGGPDYQDAIFEATGAGVVRGDVEFHVRASHWVAHGHARDPRYNDVVLHVVWTDDTGSTIREDGRRIPTLVVGSGEAAAAARSTQLLTSPCVTSFEALSREELIDALRLLGIQRFHERRDRLAADLSEQPADQVIYSALLEALGYASNREAFRQLAEVMPYRSLLSYPPGMRLHALLDAAGFETPGPGLAAVRLPIATWRLSRLRPQNHPARRLAGVVELLGRSGDSISDHLCTVVLTARRQADIRRALMTSSDGERQIGQGRADEIAASVVLPFVAALMPSAPQPEAIYAGYPSPPSNRWTRAMQCLLAEAGHEVVPRTAAVHQGIHLLFHRYCRAERTDRCPICRAARVRLVRE